jgi:hypothetical protein
MPNIANIQVVNGENAEILTIPSIVHELMQVVQLPWVAQSKRW